MVKRIVHEASSLTTYSAHWQYIVCGLVAACLVVVGGLSVCAYRCYQQRRRGRRSIYEANSPTHSGLIGAASSPSGSSANRTKDLHSDEAGGPTGRSVTKSPSLPGNGQSAAPRPHVEKPSSLQYGPPRAVHCQGKIVQTQCYVSNEKERLIRSPEVSSTCDEKKESGRETKGDESDEETKKHLGSFEFTVAYDNERSTLIVSVLKAKNLPVKNTNIGSSDPYVKLQLLPDKKHKVKTRVLRKTVNPVFDETFTFYGIDENQLSSITLHFVVLSFDRFSRDDVIGEVVYQLDEFDPCSSTKSVLTLCRQITHRQNQLTSQGHGELLVSICHHPAASRLTVVVLKARDLPKMDITGLADPYVKIYLSYDGQRIAKKKTRVSKRTLNPVFNESFIFDLPSSLTCELSTNQGVLSSVSIEMVLLDWDQVTKNEVIGRIEIGSNTGVTTEACHWAEVISYPRKQIASWHQLKD